MWDLNILEKPTSKSKHSIRRAVNHFCAGCKKNNCPCMQIEVGLSGEGWMYVKFKFYFYLCSYLKSIFVTGFLARKKWHRHINYWRFPLLRTSKKFREKSFLSHRPRTRKKIIVKRISLEKREYRPNSAVLSPRYGLRTPSSSYLMQMTHLCWWIYIFLFRSLPSSSSKLTSPFPVAEQKLERTNTFVYMLKQQHWFAHTISTIVLISDFNFSGILFMLHMNKDRWWTYHRQKPQSASRGSNRRKQRNHGLHIELGMPNGKNLSAPIYIRMSLIVDVKFFLGERMDTVWWHDNVKHMLKQCSIETSPHALTSQLRSILARRSET